MPEELTDNEIRENFNKIFRILHGDGTPEGPVGLVGMIQRLHENVAELLKLRKAPEAWLFSTVSHVLTALVTGLVLAAFLAPAKSAPVPKPAPSAEVTR